MATFVFSTALNSINSKKNSIINTFNNSPFGYFFNDKNSWKDDKIKNKLGELSIQTSTYNKVIPNIYGTVKLAGNVIWLSEVKEVKQEYVNTIKTGKNSKISQNNVVYYYFISVAIAICKGEVEKIEKVWADNELIDLNNFSHRIYYGTSTQEPDSLIQSIEGINKTCAYKDICYIVFENFPLSNYGNRLPNFTFEVKRKNLYDKNDKNLLENKITGINLIPACGEFVYSTTVQSKIKSYTDGYNELNCNERERINQNNNDGKADCLVSLDNLKNTLPNCEWISVVVSWFGSDLDISKCEIKPKVEYNFDGYDFITSTLPDTWYVGKWNRNNAEVVGKDNNGNIRYGGTPSDNSVIELLTELKNRGYKIVLYPMIFMDIDNKPWRGYLTGKSNDINSFFTKTNGYNEFILHYAELSKNYVDAFIIGSELKGITSINDGNGNFYGVDNLINLAKLTKQIINNDNIKISYASDWSEYHHTEAGWYNLDDLWSSEYIDFIGIDAYFPLTNLKQENISKNDIINGWSSGEFYDYYYDNNGNKNSLEPQYAIKNINYWWSNNHINPNGVQTSWIPKSKKIWFTEYGFASVDVTTNEPSKFYDKNSIDGGFPKLSDGISDFYYQRMALEASEEAFKSFEFLEEKFVWCWDARPYPYFPSLKNIWSDADSWKYGHWINGKMGIVYAEMLIKQLFLDAGLNTDLIGKVDIDENINGIAINTDSSLQEILNLLKKTYFFDFIESNGKFNFISNSLNTDVTDINTDELIIQNEKYISLTSTPSSDLPNKVNVNFLDINNGYDSTIVYSSRENNLSNKIDTITLPIVLDEIKAKRISEIYLYSSWLEKNVFEFILPIKYIFLEVGDKIRLYKNNTILVLKIVKLDILNDFVINIKAIQFDNSIYKTNIKSNNENYITQLLESIGATNLQIFELPALNNEMLNNPYLFFTINGIENGWKGANLYYSENSNDYNLIESKNENSIYGILLNELKPSRPYYFDLENKINIMFHSGIDENLLNSIDYNSLYNQNNLALLGNEIIQFKDISLNEDGTYTLKNLLRGLFGTEEYINNHFIGDRFILLKKSELTEYKLDISKLQNKLKFKAVSFGNDLLTTDSNEFIVSGKNLKPLKISHLRKIINSDKSITIKWNRIDRGIQNWNDNIDSILSETEEKYCIKYYDENNNILNTFYSNEQEHNINNPIPYKISVCQVNSFCSGKEKWYIV